MTKKQIFAIEHLEAKGIDFSKDSYVLNYEEKAIISDEAKAYGYRPRENGSSISSNKTIRFYLFLQRLYPRYRKTYYSIG